MGPAPRLRMPSTPDCSPSVNRGIKKDEQFIVSFNSHLSSEVLSTHLSVILLWFYPFVSDMISCLVLKPGSSVPC